MTNNANIAGRQQHTHTHKLTKKKWKPLAENERATYWKKVVGETEKTSIHTQEIKTATMENEKWEAKKANVMPRWFLVMDIKCVGLFCLSLADVYTLRFFWMRLPTRPNAVWEEIDWKGLWWCCAHFRSGCAISPLSFAVGRTGQPAHLYFYLSDVWEDIAVSIMVLFYPISMAPHLPRPFWPLPACFLTKLSVYYLNRNSYLNPVERHSSNLLLSAIKSLFRRGFYCYHFETLFNKSIRLSAYWRYLLFADYLLARMMQSLSNPVQNHRSRFT